MGIKICLFCRGHCKFIRHRGEGVRRPQGKCAPVGLPQNESQRTDLSSLFYELVQQAGSKVFHIKQSINHKSLKNGCSACSKQN